MVKLSKAEGNRYMFQCPGCECAHFFQVAPGVPAWSWNGDMNEPTISPSLLVNGTERGRAPGAIRCHSFIHLGNIQFLDDCDHALRGQTVPIPEW